MQNLNNFCVISSDENPVPFGFEMTLISSISSSRVSLFAIASPVPKVGNVMQTSVEQTVIQFEDYSDN
jgi:hypothetical protein